MLAKTEWTGCGVTHQLLAYPKPYHIAPQKAGECCVVFCSRFMPCQFVYSRNVSAAASSHCSMSATTDESESASGWIVCICCWCIKFMTLIGQKVNGLNTIRVPSPTTTLWLLKARPTQDGRAIFRLSIKCLEQRWKRIKTFFYVAEKSIQTRVSHNSQESHEGGKMRKSMLPFETNRYGNPLLTSLPWTSPWLLLLSFAASSDVSLFRVSSTTPASQQKQYCSPSYSPLFFFLF